MSQVVSDWTNTKNVCIVGANYFLKHRCKPHAMCDPKDTVYQQGATGISVHRAVNDFRQWLNRETMTLDNGQKEKQ